MRWPNAVGTRLVAEVRCCCSIYKNSDSKCIIVERMEETDQLTRGVITEGAVICVGKSNRIKVPAFGSENFCCACSSEFMVPTRKPNGES